MLVRFLGSVTLYDSRGLIRDYRLGKLAIHLLTSPVLGWIEGCKVFLLVDGTIMILVTLRSELQRYYVVV